MRGLGRRDRAGFGGRTSWGRAVKRAYVLDLSCNVLVVVVVVVAVVVVVVVAAAAVILNKWH